MSTKLWITGLNPFQAESCSAWKEIHLNELLGVEELSCRVLVRFTSLYAFIAHGKTLHTFCILTEQRTIACLNSEIVSLAANSKYCLALLSSGQLVKCDPSTGLSTPVDFLGIEHAQEGPVKESITHIACGECVALACSTTNGVYNIPNHTTSLPRHVRVRKVAAGFEHCLLLTSNGDVYTWGGGLRGQLGNGEIAASQSQPALVEGLAGVKIVDIAADGWHSAAVSSFGDLYTWGWNNQGQLGLPDRDHNGRVVSHPQLVSFPGDEELTVDSVHCGVGHTLVEASTAKDGVKAVYVAGWDLETRFSYARASVAPSFGGFRQLQRPPLADIRSSATDVGAGANQIYFLQRTGAE